MPLTHLPVPPVPPPADHPHGEDGKDSISFETVTSAICCDATKSRPFDEAYHYCIECAARHDRWASEALSLGYSVEGMRYAAERVRDREFYLCAAIGWASK